ncbi:hydroxymethylglutaryl-CoA synthase [Streptomyces sp. NPDC058486]|uniref:hydroxymethylglutaryl-CoA synthase n=1 Tax=unclassified Streptomyces TaxID=2593676 RepID=UPI003669DF22
MTYQVQPNAEPRAIGIHDLSFATTRFVLPHAELARRNGVPVEKYHIGIGQQSMSVPAADEDIVTMAAAAAAPILKRHGKERIRTVLLATETSIDQSKAAGVYVHSLLGLSPHARVVELKQACYAATAALQCAIGLIHQNPQEQVLVIASDVSQYDLASPGEATQGAGAVALLISADPALLRVDGPSGLYCADIMDFWRPNYRQTALVEGRMSVSAYLRAVEGAWSDYTLRGGREIEAFHSFCYHQPFTKMAHKAHAHLLRCQDEALLPDSAFSGGISPAEDTKLSEELVRAVGYALRYTTEYNAVIGNSYTASMYLALASLLDHAPDLTGHHIGLFSYGSGSVAEFFGATVVAGYRAALRTEAHAEALSQRIPVDYSTYRRLRRYALPQDGGEYRFPRQTGGLYRLAGISGHKRQYIALED